MQPALNAGDITLIISAPAATIKVGDIIQYRTTDAPIIHRVIDKYEASGSLWFITQGDANNAPDNPVNERQVMGKAVFTIPQLGWVSIAIKEFAAATYKFLTDLPQTLERVWASIATNGVYIASALAFTAYSYLLLTYREQKNEKRK
jgi:signal peptidase I